MNDPSINESRFTVALVGADGAGKTTIARRVERAPAGNGSGLRLKYLYMGANPEAATYRLPTTSLLLAVKRALGRPTHQGGPPDPSRRTPARGPVRRTVRATKSALRMTNQVAEEWYRQMVAWWFRRRGFVVLFDRHFFCDHYAHDVAARGSIPLLRRLHGRLLQHVYPKPDLLIVLDAPANVLFARKGEGTPDLLEQRRREYLDLAGEVPHATIVDASRSEDEVTRDVIAAIRDFMHGDHDA